jgi:hypothetical protein
MTCPTCRYNGPPGFVGTGGGLEPSPGCGGTMVTHCCDGLSACNDVEASNVSGARNAPHVRTLAPCLRSRDGWSNRNVTQHISGEPPMKNHRRLLGASFGALIALGATASAQQGTTSGQPGSTSGPASGTSVVPSTAVQKQNPTGQGTGAEAAQGAMGAGAPGASARPGTQGGPPPDSNATGSVQSPATEAAQGGIGAGSPGLSAKPGTQGGASPETGTK